jgi:hypothetical protein
MFNAEGACGVVPFSGAVVLAYHKDAKLGPTGSDLKKKEKVKVSYWKVLEIPMLDQ